MDKNSEGGGVLDFFKDCNTLVKKYPFLTWMASAGIGCLSGFLSASIYLDSKIGGVVEERLKPYEALMAGLSLNSGEEYSKASQVFEEIIGSSDIGKLPEYVRNLAYDGLLLAVANVDYPDGHQVSVNKISTRLGVLVEETPWRTHQLAWYMMRVGNYSLASKYFNSSRRSYESRREYDASVDPLRGLLILSLLEGKVDEAVSYVQLIKSRKPINYRGNEDFIAEIRALQYSRLFDPFNAVHGESLSKTIDDYVAALSVKP